MLPMRAYRYCGVFAFFVLVILGINLMPLRGGERVLFAHLNQFVESKTKDACPALASTCLIPSISRIYLPVSSGPPLNLAAIYMLALDGIPGSPHNLANYYNDIQMAIQQATINATTKIAIILVDQDGIDDTRILVIQNGQITQVNGLPNPDLNNQLDTNLKEYNMTDHFQLGSFLVWARSTYPTTKTTLSYIGQGTGLAPKTNMAAFFPSSYDKPVVFPTDVDAFSDFHTGPSGGFAVLSPYDLAEALRIGTYNGANPIDLLNIAHPFAMTIEEVYELANPNGPAPYAQVITGSPNYAYFSPKIIEATLANWSVEQTPAQLADVVLQATQTILYQADLMDNDPDVEHPYILTAVQASAIPPIKQAIDQLSALLINRFQIDRTDTYNRIISALSMSDKYDTTYAQPQDFDLNTHDGLSDLGQFADALAQSFADIDGEISDVASQISDLVDQAVLETSSRSGQPWFAVVANGGLIPTWAFHGQGLALYTDILGYAVDGIPCLGFQSRWYKALETDDNPYPYAFVVHSQTSPTTWADVLAIFWEEENFDIVFRLPVYQMLQKQTEQP